MRVMFRLNLYFFVYLLGSQPTKNLLLACLTIFQPTHTR